MIKYVSEITCTKEELAKLFLSARWNSGKYPDKLYKSIRNSTYKIFAYDNENLIGLVAGLSGKCISLFISYLIVSPEYQKKKIGSSLLNQIINIKPFNRIELITDIKDKNFYLKNDFIENGIGMFKNKW